MEAGGVLAALMPGWRPRPASGGAMQWAYSLAARFAANAAYTDWIIRKNSRRIFVTGHIKQNPGKPGLFNCVTSHLIRST